MATLLYIKSSIFGDQGQSSQLAAHYIDQWRAVDPQAQVIERDLISSDLPYLDAQVMQAINAEPEVLSEQQLAVRALADQLLAELQQADEILLALPFYNFNIPAQLKSYFDLLARAGVTFKYTEQGPVGMIADKPVRILATRGGQYHAHGNDFQIPFVQQFLGFIGLTQTEVVYAEGLAMAEMSGPALAAAREQLTVLRS